MRIFVDVGAHYGETLEVALDPKWGFDCIFALEPASSCRSLLKQFRDKRLCVEPFALGANDGAANLYGAGLLGGSLLKSKKQKAKVDELITERVQVRRAREWLASRIPKDADVFVKLNCEGAECDIIDDWLDAGLAPRLTSVYIDFDICKVPGEAHRQAQTENGLRNHLVRYETSETLDGTANVAVRTWLAKDCPQRRPRIAERLHYRLALFAPPYVRAKLLARLLLPRTIFWWLARRYGRMSRPL